MSKNANTQTAESVSAESSVLTEFNNLSHTEKLDTLFTDLMSNASASFANKANGERIKENKTSISGSTRSIIHTMVAEIESASEFTDMVDGWTKSNFRLSDCGKGGVQADTFKYVRDELVKHSHGMPAVPATDELPEQPATAGYVVEWKIVLKNKVPDSWKISVTAESARQAQVKADNSQALKDLKTEQKAAEEKAAADDKADQVAAELAQRPIADLVQESIDLIRSTYGERADDILSGIVDLLTGDANKA